MKASIVELRTKMKDITKALSRNESVTILSHGKVIGHLTPPKHEKKQKKVSDHPFFGSRSDDENVTDIINTLRQPRC